MIEIELNNVKKNYGLKNVLDGVSFEVKTDERIALIGENGSRKIYDIKNNKWRRKHKFRSCKYKKRFLHRVFKTSLWQRTRKYKCGELS